MFYDHFSNVGIDFIVLFYELVVWLDEAARSSSTKGLYPAIALFVATSTKTLSLQLLVKNI